MPAGDHDPCYKVSTVLVKENLLSKPPRLVNPKLKKPLVGEFELKIAFLSVCKAYRRLDFPAPFAP
jgi:hypothetical protein